MSKKILSQADVIALAYDLSLAMKSLPSLMGKAPNSRMLRGYAIPRGGVPAAYLLAKFFDYIIVDDPELCDFFIDDIIDSGSTFERYCDEYPGKMFLALIDKRDVNGKYNDHWVVFPWERSEDAADHSFTDNVVRLLQYVGEDPTRGGLIETPARVAKAWAHWCSGYGKDPGEILKVFEDGAESYDQMVTVKDIPIFSHCEHHLAPIFGTCTISYIPNGKIVGLSKLSRLADMFARRLQVQERLTNQIADALQAHLQPLGVGVHIKARHLCMESRGVCQQGHHTVTTALLGEMKHNQQTREEFMSTVR